MSLENKNYDSSEIKVVFAGGGTGGHIYPGLGVADAFRKVCQSNGITVKILWIGNSKGMDRNIVENNVDENGRKSADVFYGIPSGKLRRYFSIQNFFDLFKIFAGFVASFFILLKEKPAVLFSKGGFVSVPPCFCAKLLRIPVYTHECDFTPGLATKLNSKVAKTVLLSYEETKNYLPEDIKNKAVLTGNPVRPVFYSSLKERGYDFLGIKNPEKPVLLVVGGSLGAKQINDLVKENVEALCKNYIVVHQTGQKNVEDSQIENASEDVKNSYKSYPFIYSQMPDVIACADVVLSRAGANSIWECSVLSKPLILIPLCGNGTRGDQEDNAAYFEKTGAAIVLGRENANSQRLLEALDEMKNPDVRAKYSNACGNLSKDRNSAENISKILYTEIIR